MRQSLRRGTCVSVISMFAMLCIGGASVQAQEVNADRFTLRGFGTLAGTWQDAKDVDFRRFVGQPSGVGKGNIEFQPDSIAGLQVNARIGSDLSATVQGVTACARTATGIRAFTGLSALVSRRVSWRFAPAVSATTSIYWPSRARSATRISRCDRALRALWLAGQR